MPRTDWRPLAFGSKGGRMVGYRTARFCCADRKLIYRLVHHLVLEAFVGPRPDGMECRHLDGNPHNNRVDNLAWGTREENGADKSRHGKLKGNNSKQTPDSVRAIRASAAQGIPLKQIAADFHATVANIRDIVLRRRWKHVV